MIEGGLCFVLMIYLVFCTACLEYNYTLTLILVAFGINLEADFIKREFWGKMEH